MGKLLEKLGIIKVAAEPRRKLEPPNGYRKGYVHGSASQIEQFIDCNAQWGFQRIDKIPRPSSWKADFGKGTHGVQEDWLKHSKKPPDTPMGQCFSQVLAKGWLPAPSKDLEVEVGFEFEPLPEVLLWGYKDLQYIRDGVWWIVDLKTTSDFRYALLEEEMRLKVQPLLYAADAFYSGWNGPVRVDYHYQAWNHKKARPKGVRRVRVEYEPDSEFADLWSKVLEVTAVMAHKRRTVKHAIELERNAGHCDAFGGCHYRGNVCKVTSAERLKSHWRKHEKTNLTKNDRLVNLSTTSTVTEKRMGLLDKIKEAAAEEPKETTTSTPTETKTKSRLQEKMDALKDKSNGKAATGAEGIVPPDEPKPETTTTTEAEAASAPGRKRKTVAEAKVEGYAEGLAAGKAEAPGTATEDGMTLYINAFPIKSDAPVVFLTDIVASFRDELNEALGKPHWKLADFGKGAAAVAVAVDGWLDDNEHPASLYVNTHTDEGRATVDVLSARATRIVQGI